MLTSITNKRMRNSNQVTSTSDVLREAGIHRTNTKSQTNMLFCQKEDQFRKQRPNLLHKLSLDANSIAISYWQI